MNQILIHYGSFVLPAYGFFVGLALVLGMGMGELRAREIGLPRFAMLDLAFICALFGILGAGVFHFMFSGGNLPGHAGRSFFGGVLGGSLAGVAYARWRKIPLLQALDCLFLYLPLGHALGRIGCWFYGCCHGAVCSPSFPLATAFPRVDAGGGRLAGSPAFVRHLKAGLINQGAEHSLTVYPTQILSALLLVGVFLILRSLSKKPSVSSRPGTIFCLYLLLGGVARFGEEFFRDHTRYLGLITNAQLVSVLTMAAGAIGLYLLREKITGVAAQGVKMPLAKKRRRRPAA